MSAPAAPKHGRFTLLGLPLNLRLKIFRLLLKPDQLTVRIYRPDGEDLNAIHPVNAISNKVFCDFGMTLHPTILRTNRDIYQETKRLIWQPTVLNVVLSANMLATSTELVMNIQRLAGLNMVDTFNLDIAPRAGIYVCDIQAHMQLTKTLESAPRLSVNRINITIADWHFDDECSMRLDALDATMSILKFWGALIKPPHVRLQLDSVGFSYLTTNDDNELAPIGVWTRHGDREWYGAWIVDLVLFCPFYTYRANEIVQQVKTWFRAPPHMLAPVIPAADAQQQQQQQRAMPLASHPARHPPGSAPQLPAEQRTKKKKGKRFGTSCVLM